MTPLLILALVLAVLTVGGALLGAHRLRKTRKRRKTLNLTRESFAQEFRNSGIPVEIPLAVHDYYSSEKGWSDFPFQSSDRFSEVLYDDPDDLADDVETIVTRLGLVFPPEYVLQRGPSQPIKTLRDMVVWLDFIRNHQPGGGKPASPLGYQV